jgi:hypothetical protein
MEEEEELEEGEMLNESEGEDHKKKKAEARKLRVLGDELAQDPIGEEWKEIIERDGKGVVKEVREAYATLLGPIKGYDCFDVSLDRGARAKIVENLDKVPRLWNIPDEPPPPENNAKTKDYERTVAARQREIIQGMKAVDAAVFNGVIGNDEGAVVAGAQAIGLLSHLLTGENLARVRVTKGPEVEKNLRRQPAEPLIRPGQMERLREANERDRQLRAVGSSFFRPRRRSRFPTSGGFFYRNSRPAFSFRKWRASFPRSQHQQAPVQVPPFPQYTPQSSKPQWTNQNQNTQQDKPSYKKFNFKSSSPKN